MNLKRLLGVGAAAIFLMMATFGATEKFYRVERNNSDPIKVETMEKKNPKKKE